MAISKKDIIIRSTAPKPKAKDKDKPKTGTIRRKAGDLRHSRKMA